MNEQELSKFIPNDAIFVRSMSDGKSGVFSIWFKRNSKSAVEKFSFIKQAGHWVFSSETAAA